MELENSCGLRKSSQGGGRKGWARGAGWQVRPKEEKERGKGQEEPGPPRQELRPVNSAGETDRTPWPGGPSEPGCGQVLYCTEKKELSLGRQTGRSVFPAHGQVHEGEYVELRHDGETQEHAVQEKAPAPKLLVQLPLVQVNTEHLQHTEGVRGQRPEGPWAGH